MRPERERWLDRKENVDRVYYAVWGICALLIAGDVIVHRHASFEIENWFGFYGLFGFVACVGLVLAAKALRRWLRRAEDYYGDERG